LAEARALKGRSELVFPSQSTGKALSDMTFTKLLRDLGLGAVATAHGFRSAFRDWASEIDKMREVVAEAALAHSVRDKTEGAYRRAAYLEERRSLMERWAAYSQGELGADHGDPVDARLASADAGGIRSLSASSPLSDPHRPAAASMSSEAGR
jgi:hypothetical protein